MISRPTPADDFTSLMRADDDREQLDRILEDIRELRRQHQASVNECDYLIEVVKKARGVV